MQTWGQADWMKESKCAWITARTQTHSSFLSTMATNAEVKGDTWRLPLWNCHRSTCHSSYKETSMLCKPHTDTEQSRMISVNCCQTELPLPPWHAAVHNRRRGRRGLTPQDSMSGKDLRTHFRLGWAIEQPGGPLGCRSRPTLRLPLLLHRRSAVSSRGGQPDRAESILCWRVCL